MSGIRYVPVLKGKKNDLAAFRALPLALRASMKPLIDMPFFGRDADLNAVVNGFIEQLYVGMGDSQACFVDFYPLQDQATVRSGGWALVEAYERLHDLGRTITPVVGLGRDLAAIRNLRDGVARLGQGVCLRVDAEAIEDQADQVAEDIRDRLEVLRVSRADCDILIDLRCLGRLNFQPVEAILDLVAVLSQGGAFRSIITAGSSALLDVTSVPLNGVLHVQREELALWDRLVFELAGTVVPVFADYGVVHPEFFAEGPRPHANAKIRYTNGARTTYFRGHGLYRPVKDFEQYRALANRVMAEQFFDGAAFSSGDAYIEQVAIAPGPRGFGNLSTWLLSDTNRHLSVVAHQMSGRAERVLATNSLDETSALTR